MAVSPSVSKPNPPCSCPASIWTVYISGIFALIVIGLLLGNWIEIKFVFPTRENRLVEMRRAWAKDSTNDRLASDIRILDERLRSMRITREVFARRGAMLLLAFVAVNLVALKITAVSRRTIPHPHPDPEAVAHQLQSARQNRFAIGVGLAILFLIVLALYWIPAPKYPSVSDSPTAGKSATQSVTDSIGSPMQINPNDVSTKPVPAPPLETIPSIDEFKMNWPSFRGHDGSGVCFFDNIPAQWDESGKNIAWKTSLDGLLPGNNSPIIWGDKIYFTGADPKNRQVYCFAVTDGKLLWKADIPSLDKSPEPLEMGEETGYASCTMVTDGLRAYVLYPTGDIAAVDTSGKLVWNKNLGRPQSTYGYASSLGIDQTRVIVQFDQGAAEDNLSKLIAFDGATGHIVWEVKRPVRDSWTSPVVVQIAGSRQIITIADPWTIAYNPVDGKEIWRAEAVTGDVAPSPIVADGNVIAIEPYNQVVAIAADGSGDVTKTHVRSIGDDAIPDIASPVTNGKFLWMITTEGVLTCYKLGDPAPPPIDDAHKRNPRFRWEHEFRKDNFHASLSLVSDKLYIQSAKGVMHIVSAADTFSQIGSNTLPDKFDATPAFMDGTIVLRGKSFLWCIKNQ